MTDLFDSTGRVALITGSAGGLGLQIARALARAGAAIALCDIDATRLEDAKEQIRGLGVDCESFVCDLSDHEEIKALFLSVPNRFDRIDILVNDAGISYIDPATSYTDGMWQKIMDINLNAYYLCAREAAERMKAQGWGRIINIASMHSEIEMKPSCWPLTGYCTTKGAVKGMTRAMAVELAPYGITVNAIGPGYFEGTGMTKPLDTSRRFNAVLPSACPMGRMGREGELDGLVVYLASDSSRYLTGQTILVDGGWSCA